MLEVMFDKFFENLTGRHISGIIGAKNESGRVERSEGI